MSNSDKDSEQSWVQLMQMYFSVKLSASEAIAWFIELRRTTAGWKHDPALDGTTDPCKGEKAKAINVELCNVIRYIADLDTIPRKSDGGKNGDYKGKPNVKDLGLWIWIYKKSTSKATGFGIHQRFVEVCRDAIKELVEEGRRFDASILAENPMGIMDKHWHIWEVGGNRGYSADEQVEIKKYCDEIGLNIQEEHNKFYEQDTGRKPVSQYASHLTEKWDAEQEEIFG